MFVFAAGVGALTATFDGLAEGTSGTVITDGGLAFENLDNRGLSPPPGTMSIEQADATLTGFPGFTPNNALGFGGYSPGSGGAFGRFGSVDVVSAIVGGGAELTIFEPGGAGGLTVQLEALLGGVVVDTDSVALSGAFTTTAHTLSVTGTHDRLRLSVGPNPTDVAFLLIDTVTVTPALPDTGDTGAAAPTGDTGIEPVPPIDSGEPPDTGAPPEDTGPTTPGTTWTPTDDPLPPEDTGAADEKGGCGCASGAPSGAMALVGALLVARRRR